MWIVVTLEPYYPSVYHFTSKEEAEKWFNECAARSKHLAYVERTEIDEDDTSIKRTDINTWNIEW
jgi:hypothetical protein